MYTLAALQRKFRDPRLMLWLKQACIEPVNGKYSVIALVTWLDNNNIK